MYYSLYLLKEKQILESDLFESMNKNKTTGYTREKNVLYKIMCSFLLDTQ